MPERTPTGQSLPATLAIQAASAAALPDLSGFAHSLRQFRQLATLCAAGWARSFGRYSERYAPEEKEAANTKAGVHGHKCLPPWEWRAQQRR